jgi:predicted kinase
MIVVLFGQPGSGKTTLAKKLKGFTNLDGDELRNLYVNQDYSRQGRVKNLNRASDLALFLHSRGENVVLSLVYPYWETREYLRSLYKDVRFVYLVYDYSRGKDNYQVKDFEMPSLEEQVLCLSTSLLTEEECLEDINKFLES